MSLVGRWGGYGAWEWGAAFPNRWLAVVPIAGGGDLAWADKLKDSNIWAWHGALDRGVRPEQSRKLVEAIKAAGGNPRFSDVVDGDHNIWLQAYGDDSLYAWMLSPKSDPTKLKPITSRNKEAVAAPLTVGTALPFVPALDMSHAGYVRLGNEALGTIADTIPKVVPTTMLTGRLADISDYTESDGYGFSVYMSGISYRAELARSVIKTTKPNHLLVQLGLSNAQISIGGTSLSGDRHSAQAGPISIVVGHVRPVWLSIDVTPVVVNRKLRFKLNGSQFSIPNDNWYVTAPAGVSTQGFGMTEGKVSNGLTSGLYGRKGMIEQKVEGIVPNLIVELEKKLDEALTSRTVGGAWPLPVYQPQLRVWPIEVATDELGVTLVMGATAGAVDFTKPPKSVRTVDLGGPKADKIPQLSKLQLGLVPGMIGPLSEMAVEADVFRIHVADTPSPVLAKLADLAVLADAIPDLKHFNNQVEIWTELAVTAPIIVSDNDGQIPALSTKGLKLRVLTRPTGTTESWKPYAEFEVALKQSFSPKLVRPSSLTRAVALAPEGGVAVEVSGKFSADYTPQDSQIDLAKIQGLFTEGWNDFLNYGGAPQIDVADLDFGYTKLRADEVQWSSPSLAMTFGPPGIRITNSSSISLVYETKGPYSGWGGPYTLKPGEHHQFPITYPMIFRRQVGGNYQMYTLPVGTHSEFRIKYPGTPEALYKGREPDEIEKSAANSPSSPADAKPETK